MLRYRNIHGNLSAKLLAGVINPRVKDHRRDQKRNFTDQEISERSKPSSES